MKKKWAIILIIIIITGICISFIGCQKKPSTKEEIYSDFQEKINDMSSYTCTAEITAIGNKSEHNYIFIHTYKKPSTYKLEVVSPEHLKGKTMEYTEEKISIRNPDIDDVIELPNAGKNEQYMFIGDFIKNYLQNEEVKITSSDANLILETYIPGDNEYINKQVLYVNSDNQIPESMEILDSEGNARFVVKYKDFQWK